MKTMLYCLLTLGVCNFAWADVQITFKDISGATSSMYSNGRKVRINGGRMPGYLLVDSASGEFFMVEPQRKEIVRVDPGEIAGMAEVSALNVSLKSRGGGEKIAGYSTGRFDLIANGMACGTIYGSSELIRNSELRRMFAAMQGMHKLARVMVAGVSPMLTECQRASARLADLADSSGFVLRVIDDKGAQVFEVLSLDTDATVDQGEYELPQGMRLIDMNEKMKAAANQGQQMLQQMPDMNRMMQQMQQNGGQMTPEMQQQLQDMMKQLQQQQAQ
jgi:hypothetical protein